MKIIYCIKINVNILIIIKIDNDKSIKKINKSCFDVIIIYCENILIDR